MKFRLNYDDNGIDIIEKISNNLTEYGLIIKDIDEGDGWIDYIIQNIEIEKDNNIEFKNYFLTDVSQFDKINIKNEISKLNNRVIYGEIEQPTYFDISLKNVSHIIQNISIIDDKIYGDVTILNTPKGKILKNAIKHINNNYELIFKMRYNIDENKNINIFTWDVLQKNLLK